MHEIARKGSTQPPGEDANALGDVGLSAEDQEEPGRGG